MPRFFLICAALACLLPSFGQGSNPSTQDDLKALRVLAAKGNADAQWTLGFMYTQGEGVPQDYAEAVRWYRKAAEQGDRIGQRSLGIMYEKGQGVVQDYAEAVRWYRKAAEQGDAIGQWSLGLMYHHGTGVPQDYVQAHKWTNLAAASLSGDTQKDVASLRDKIAAKMTPAQIAEAQRLAREWKPQPKR